MEQDKVRATKKKIANLVASGKTLHLSDRETNEIISLLKANKPLPDKYRFMIFEDKQDVELLWNGKSNEVCNIVLPFQTIEHIDEPRDKTYNSKILKIDDYGRQVSDWSNKLIWGDNKLILSSLKNGPLRKQIEDQGGIKLIYIDPPFDVGADFSMNIEIGGNNVTKNPSILEEIAYRDTWGKGTDSFIAMIYERLVLMRDLLSDDGSVYIHCDWRVNSYMRLILNEIFGSSMFCNEIIWRYSGWNKALKNSFEKRHDNILFFRKNNKPVFNSFFEKWKSKDEYVKVRKQKVLTDTDGREYVLSDAGGGKRIKRYIDEVLSQGVVVDDVWLLDKVNNSAKEVTGYPTQKPESLLERIIKASSNQNDIIADFFCGSGTTVAVAEKLGRRWIAADLGKFAIHTTRKRIIEVQKQLKAEERHYNPFEVLNLGKYERQHFIGVNINADKRAQEKQLQEKENAFLELILHAYQAQITTGYKTLHGKKGERFVVVGPVNMPINRLYIKEISKECLSKGINNVDVLGFEFEPGISPHELLEAKKKGIDIRAKYIPREVFDKRAIEKNQVVFHDVAYIDANIKIKNDNFSVSLTNYSVYYSSDLIANTTESIKGTRNAIIIENGQIILVKVDKHKNGKITKEKLTKHWSDWIDYWAVDFDFENKKEIIHSFDSKTKQWKEVWTGDYVFENHWQSYRTRKDRDLLLQAPSQILKPGVKKIAIKVVDIFGNDTMKIFEINNKKGK